MTSIYFDKIKMAYSKSIYCIILCSVIIDRTIKYEIVAGYRLSNGIIKINILNGFGIIDDDYVIIINKLC